MGNVALSATGYVIPQSKVAWMERSAIRRWWCIFIPDSTSFHPGYLLKNPLSYRGLADTAFSL